MQGCHPWVLLGKLYRVAECGMFNSRSDILVSELLFFLLSLTKSECGGSEYAFGGAASI